MPITGTGRETHVDTPVF